MRKFLDLGFAQVAAFESVRALVDAIVIRCVVHMASSKAGRIPKSSSRSGKHSTAPGGGALPRKELARYPG